MQAKTLLRRLACLLLVLLALPGGPAPSRKPKGTEATVPAEFAAYLAQLAAKVHVLRISRKERSRTPGLGPMVAAFGHVHGHPDYPTDPEERRLMEDLLTVMEKEPDRAHEVPALRARMVTHYLHHTHGTPGGGAHG